MKTLKKTLSVILAVAMLACLCISMSMTGYAAGETITAEVVGTYAQSDAAQDVTVRISINGLSEPYCGFYIDNGVTLPDGWTLKSYSTSNTAQPIKGGDYNTANGKLNYADDDTEDTIPADTYYEAVITAPAGASGDFSIVFKNVMCAKTYGTVVLVSANTVTANGTITGNTPAAEGYTVTVGANTTNAAVGDTVLVTLDVSNNDKTAFSTFDGKLAYDNTVFTYSASDNNLPANCEVTDNSGTLTIRRYGDAVTISDTGAELTLAFTAAAAGTGTFTLEAGVSEANEANGNILPATVSGTPSVAVSQTYTVTFVGGDGATGTAPTQDPVTAGTVITLPANTFAKEGNTFAGWNDGTNTYNAGDEYTVNGNVTFTAQWTENAPTPTETASIITGYLDGYTLIKVTTENATQTPTYDGNVMYKLSGNAYNADAYYYIVPGTISQEAAQAKLAWSDTDAMTLTKTDANQTGVNDINDAQFIYNLYNSVSVSYDPTVAQLLASDMNRDGTVDTDDCAAAIAAIQ